MVSKNKKDGKTNMQTYYDFFKTEITKMGGQCHSEQGVVIIEKKWYLSNIQYIIFYVLEAFSL